ncbi:MAG: tetratricopeptide repeat protein [Caldilinea sp. CFX5]|nr:tetratricopeptide repeat protein [Caldilinea sp. CFX5]
MQMSGDRLAAIEQALLDGFDRQSLSQLVRFELNESLDKIADGANLQSVVFNLIAWAERNDKVIDLINAAYRYNPNNKAIQQLVSDLTEKKLSDEPSAEKLEMPPISTAKGRQQYNYQHNDEHNSDAQLLSPFTYVVISLAGLLLSVGLLIFMVFVGPRLIRQGMDKQVFYFLLIPLGVSFAAFVFGAMRSYATLSHKSGYGILDAGGPIVAAILVIVGGLYLIPVTDSFSLTVRIRSHEGSLPTGYVKLIIEASTLSQPLDTNGEAEFKSLPMKFRTSKARLSVWNEEDVRIIEQEADLSTVADIIEVSIESIEPSPSKSFSTSVVSFPTATVNEHLIVVAELYPPLSAFPRFDARDQIVDALKHEFTVVIPASGLRIEEHEQTVMSEKEALQLGSETRAANVIWGRISEGRLRVNVTDLVQPANSLVARFYQDPAKPTDTFFSENLPKQLQDFLAPFVVGLYYYTQKVFSDAKTTFDTALSKVQPPFPDGIENLYLLRGSAYYQMGDYEQARKDFNLALNLNPSMTEAYYNRALTNFNDFRLEDAIADIDKAIKIGPNLADGYVLRGSILGSWAITQEQDPGIQRGYREQAIKDFTTALQILPSEEIKSAYDIYNNRALMYGRIGNFEQANVDFAHTLGANFDCTPVRSDDFIKITSVEISNYLCSHAATNLAALYVEEVKGNYEDAVHLAELAMNIAPNDMLKVAAMETLAEAEHELGNDEKACSLIKQALEISSDDPYRIELGKQVCKGTESTQ